MVEAFHKTVHLRILVLLVYLVILDFPVHLADPDKRILHMEVVEWVFHIHMKEILVFQVDLVNLENLVIRGIPVLQDKMVWNMMVNLVILEFPIDLVILENLESLEILALLVH